MTASAPALPGERTALWSMMAGNIAIGAGVIAPAGMMNDLSVAFSAPPEVIGGLIAYGAMVLFFAAPLSAAFTNTWGRRELLTGALALFAAGHLASAFAPDFETLLGIRLAMIVSAAVFTPQAASVIQLTVPQARRASAMAFVFLGWSLASAVATPLASLGAAWFGWRLMYGALALLCAAAGYGVWRSLPARLFVPKLSASSWRRVASHPGIIAILVVTAVQLTGQFTLFPYVAAELKRMNGASPELIALTLSAFGFAGAAGNAFAQRLVLRWSVVATSSLFLAAIGLGVLLFPLFAAHAVTAPIGALIWGLGFAAVNSMQQARLGSIAPELASASIALNTSMIYLGQALGATAGGALIAAGAFAWLSPVAGLCVAAALTISGLAWWRLKV